MDAKTKSYVKIGTAVFVLYLAMKYIDVAIGFIKLMISAAFPLIVGTAVAYVVNIIMSFYERHILVSPKKKFTRKIRRPLCLFLSYLTLVLIIVLTSALVVPQLVSCTKLLINKLPGALETLTDTLSKINIVPRDIATFLEKIDWKSRIGTVISFVTSGAGSVVDVVYDTLKSVFSGVTTTVVSVIFSVYLLMSKDRIKLQFKKLFKRYLPKKVIAKAAYTYNVFNNSFRRYIVAQCTEAVILGILCAIGMLIFRMPYAAMIGALIAFTALVPIVGSFIGAALGAFMILTVSPFKALMFILFIIVLQQIEENLIYPRVVGTSVNLPGIWVLAAITVGGGVMGIAGMLVAVPIVAALYRIISDDVNRACRKE